MILYKIQQSCIIHKAGTWKYQGKNSMIALGSLQIIFQIQTLRTKSEQ